MSTANVSNKSANSFTPLVKLPGKYVEQMQKRKLLWGAKKTEDSAAKWGHAQFSEDQDGKVASKFMRLMGVKDGTDKNSSPSTSIPISTTVKSRKEMFFNMEQQYEVARQVTHSKKRGVGLGFGSQARPTKKVFDD